MKKESSQGSISLRPQPGGAYGARMVNDVYELRLGDLDLERV